MSDSHSSNLVLAYLRNMQAAQANGQTDHATSLLEQAVAWLGRQDRECFALSSSPVRLDVGIGLHPGRTRTQNEDYVFAERSIRTLPTGKQETVGLFVLADGAGGHANGQEAARLAVHAFVDAVLPKLMEDVQGAALWDLLLDGMREANYAVCLRNEDPLLFGSIMATTMTAALTVGTETYIANVGDSRAYLYRSASGLKQVTRDHSYVAQLLQAGDIEPMDVYTHPNRNVIYRALGSTFSLDFDDPVCSDGLWEMVPDPEAKAIQAILSDFEAEAPEIAEALVNLALNGGGHDNIGLVVVKTSMNVEDMLTISLPSLVETPLASLT
jgi:serine/threonine protein phosphatase PrpC